MTDRKYELTSFELDVLRSAGGVPTSRPMSWGAAMSVTLETLSYFGLLTRLGAITQKGKDFLKQMGELT